MRNVLLALATIFLGAAVTWAAGPMPDTFFVHFNDPVVVTNSLTLPPGNYKFQRITKPTDPAVFTIINGDNNQVVGSTPSADVAEGAQDRVHPGSTVVLDQVDGKDYLDSVSLQGMKLAFPVSRAVEHSAAGDQPGEADPAGSARRRTGVTPAHNVTSPPHCPCRAWMIAVNAGFGL